MALTHGVPQGNELNVDYIGTVAQRLQLPGVTSLKV